MSRPVATPTGRFHPGFMPINHPGRAEMVVEQQEKPQASRRHILKLMDATDVVPEATWLTCIQKR